MIKNIELIKEFVKTDKYKNSNYLFVEANNRIGIKTKDTGKFVDTETLRWRWDEVYMVIGSSYFNNCFRHNAKDIIKAFNELHQPPPYKSEFKITKVY